ncbi:hypothetical protein GCM10020254_72870 [Streptomyces goshikiensis]
MSETVAFPQDRTCPYHPPAAYEPLREGRPLSRVTLFDGRSVWVVTGHPEARSLLSDGRLSADRQNASFPTPQPPLPGACRTAAPPSSASTTRSTTPSAGC